MKAGRLPEKLLPFEAGIGDISNGVVSTLGRNEDIPPFKMYTEVLLDALVPLMEKGRVVGASATALTVTSETLERIYENMDFFVPRVVLRSQEFSNNPGIIRRLGVIAMNTALEVDLYGNTNSTHICGSDLMNGIGGSMDFSRNGYISFMMCPSISKGGKISNVVPMCSHVDNTEHSVSIIVTDQGLADLRGLGPAQRAKTIIEKCAHPVYRPYLHRYLEKSRMGHLRHSLRHCLAAGEEKIAELHRKGKLTARERIEALLDPGTFCEQYLFGETISREFGLDKKRVPGDGAIVGLGEIGGRTVCVMAHDSLIMGGSGASTHVRKWAQTIDQAVKIGCPYIQLSDSPGGRIQEGTNITSYVGSIFYSHTRASGIIPQITAILGRCAGGAVYRAALTDFVFIVDGLGEMFITGPAVLREITGEEVSFSDLGGARICTHVNGAADFLVANEQDCFAQIRRLLDFLPANYRQPPPELPTDDPQDRSVPDLEGIVPANPQRAYDIRRFIRKILDREDFMEVKPDFAKNIVIGFGRMGGLSIGVIAN